MPLTIVCGVYVLRLFTVSMSGCGRSVYGRFGCRVRLIQAIAMLWMSQAMNATTITHPRV